MISAKDIIVERSGNMTSKKNKPSESKLKKLKKYMLKTGDPKVSIVCELLGKYAQIKVLQLYISEIYENS